MEVTALREQVRKHYNVVSDDDIQWAKLHVESATYIDVDLKDDGTLFAQTDFPSRVPTVLVARLKGCPMTTKGIIGRVGDGEVEWTTEIAGKDAAHWFMKGKRNHKKKKQRQKNHAIGPEKDKEHPVCPTANCWMAEY